MQPLQAPTLPAPAAATTIPAPKCDPQASTTIIPVTVEGRRQLIAVVSVVLDAYWNLQDNDLTNGYEYRYNEDEQDESFFSITGASDRGTLREQERLGMRNLLDHLELTMEERCVMAYPLRAAFGAENPPGPAYLEEVIRKGLEVQEYIRKKQSPVQPEDTQAVASPPVPQYDPPTDTTLTLTMEERRQMIAAISITLDTWHALELDDIGLRLGACYNLACPIDEDDPDEDYMVNYRSCMFSGMKEEPFYSITGANDSCSLMEQARLGMRNLLDHLGLTLEERRVMAFPLQASLAAETPVMGYSGFADRVVMAGCATADPIDVRQDEADNNAPHKKAKLH